MRISRDALKSLLASCAPCLIFSSLKRTSWVEDIASRPKRVPSAPYWSISSIGSMPVPSDFDIRRPSGAWMTEWTFTCSNGIFPGKRRPSMTIRATHRKRMSRAVERTSVG